MDSSSLHAEKKAQKLHDQGIDQFYAHHNVEKALECLYQAAFLRESFLGKIHNDTALSYFRIASVLREMSPTSHHPEEALRVCRREMRITHQLMGYQALGTSLTESKERRQDEWIHERLQWIRHGWTAKDAENSSDHSQKADNYCRQLLQAMECERQGDDHYASKEFHQAIVQFNSAMALESAAYAHNQVDMADLCFKIGRCHGQLKDWDAALEEFQEALKLYQTAFGKAHGTVGRLLSSMADIFRRKREYDLALATYAKAYAIHEEVFGVEHECCRETLEALRRVARKG